MSTKPPVPEHIQEIVQRRMKNIKAQGLSRETFKQALAQVPKHMDRIDAEGPGIKGWEKEWMSETGESAAAAEKLRWQITNAAPWVQDRIVRFPPLCVVRARPRMRASNPSAGYVRLRQVLRAQSRQRNHRCHATPGSSDYRRVSRSRAGSDRLSFRVDA